ncbi:SUKH-3 domain-containing protein [Streptomyces sp. NPDC058989]|uniref:SUKH-3 domain-containing protein n=1 Tax=Streptomyces sp. NPDC058989 TaxID=3346686 RepID=UPI0036770A85
MNDTPERRALQELRDVLPESATFEVNHLDVEEACQRYTEDGYEVTGQLREFLERYGELALVLKFQNSEMELTTSVERTLASTHADPRNVRIFSKKLGQPVVLVGTAFVTEEAVLLAENDDILFFGDAGYQRIANGFENAIHALAAGDWDRTFF